MPMQPEENMSSLATIHSGPPLGDWIRFTKPSQDECFLIHSETGIMKPFHIEASEIWNTFKYELTSDFIWGVLKVITTVSFINLKYDVIKCDIRDLSSNPKERTLIFEVVDEKKLKKKKAETLQTTIKKCSQGFSEQILVRFSLEAAIIDVREDILIAMLKSGRLHQNHSLGRSRIDQNHFIDRSCTILIWAVKQKLTCLVDVLLSFQILNINAQSEDGETALMIAARLGHTTILEKLLIDRRVNLNIKDPRGETAFFKAASEGNFEEVEMFLEIPAVDLYTQAESKKTPLMKAVEGMHFKVACLIISQAKALFQLSCEDQEGNTAFSLMGSNMEKLKEVFEKRKKELEEEDEYQVITDRELEEAPN